MKTPTSFNYRVRRQAALFLTLLLGLHTISHAIDFESADREFYRQVKEGNLQIKQYLEARLNHENSNRLDEQRGCYLRKGGPVILIMTIDADGKISNVVTNKSNEMSDCFRAVYLHTQYKRPPRAPLYVKAEMGG